MTADPTRFPYKTLKIALLPSTKCLQIALHRPEKENSLNSEMLIELENIFNWAKSHIEIVSILLTSDGPTFCGGADWEELREFSPHKLARFFGRLQGLLQLQLNLPQILIVDYREKAMGAGLELGLAADLRLSSESCTLALNQIKKGHFPSGGGLGLLQTLISPSNVRNWALTGGPICLDILKAQGFLYRCYKKDENQREQVELKRGLLKNLTLQPPVQRMQAKAALQRGLAQTQNKNREENMALIRGALLAEDYRNPNAKSLEEMKEKIKSL